MRSRLISPGSSCITQLVGTNSKLRFGIVIVTSPRSVFLVRLPEIAVPVNLDEVVSSDAADQQPDHQEQQRYNGTEIKQQGLYGCDSGQSPLLRRSRSLRRQI